MNSSYCGKPAATVPQRTDGGVCDTHEMTLLHNPNCLPGQLAQMAHSQTSRHAPLNLGLKLDAGLDYCPKRAYIFLTIGLK